MKCKTFSQIELYWLVNFLSFKAIVVGKIASYFIIDEKKPIIVLFNYGLYKFEV